MMTLGNLLLMLTNAGVEVDNAAVTVKVQGVTKRGEWYADRVLEFLDVPMKSWNVSYGEKDLMILCIY